MWKQINSTRSADIPTVLSLTNRLVFEKQYCMLLQKAIKMQGVAALPKTATKC